MKCAACPSTLVTACSLARRIRGQIKAEISAAGSRRACVQQKLSHPQTPRAAAGCSAHGRAVRPRRGPRSCPPARKRSPITSSSLCRTNSSFACRPPGLGWRRPRQRSCCPSTRRAPLPMACSCSASLAKPNVRAQAISRAKAPGVIAKLISWRPIAFEAKSIATRISKPAPGESRANFTPSSPRPASAFSARGAARPAPSRQPPPAARRTASRSHRGSEAPARPVRRSSIVDAQARAGRQKMLDGRDRDAGLIGHVGAELGGRDLGASAGIAASRSFTSVRTKTTPLPASAGRTVSRTGTPEWRPTP